MINYSFFTRRMINYSVYLVYIAKRNLAIISEANIPILEAIDLSNDPNLMSFYFFVTACFIVFMIDGINITRLNFNEIDSFVNFSVN